MVKYFNNIWSGIYTVIIGMKITLRHLFVKKVTNGGFKEYFCQKRGKSLFRNLIKF